MEIPRGRTGTFQYSDIFFTHFLHNELVCSHMAKDHALVYVYSGELMLEEGERVTKVHKGECVFIRRDNRVRLTKQPKQGENYGGIYMTFKRKFLRDFFQNLDKNHIPENVEKHKQSVVKIPATPDIASLFHSMLPYFDSHIEPSEELMQLKLQEGVYSLLRVDNRFHPSLFDFTEPWKIDILDYLNENYMYDLTIEEIAGFTGRSLATFKRDFKKISNLTPQKWLIDKRLKTAYDKIRNEHKRVSDVYLEVGFKNLSHFSSAFKRQFGYSPTAS